MHLGAPVTEEWRTRTHARTHARTHVQCVTYLNACVRWLGPGLGRDGRDTESEGRPSLASGGRCPCYLRPGNKHTLASKHAQIKCTGDIKITFTPGGLPPLYSTSSDFYLYLRENTWKLHPITSQVSTPWKLIDISYILLCWYLGDEMMASIVSDIAIVLQAAATIYLYFQVLYAAISD